MKLVIPLLFFSSLIFASDQTPQISPPLVFHSGERRIAIPQRNAEGKHDFAADSCNGYGIETSQLHAFVRRGNTLYVVYTCGAPSRGPEASMKRCGSGYETQINWVAIRDGIVVDHQQRDIESCWRDIYGSIDGWRGTKLIFSSGNYEGTSTYFFDSSRPENGLVCEKYDKHS